MHAPRTTAAALAVLLGAITAGQTAALAEDDGNDRPPVAVRVTNPDPELAAGEVTTYTITVRNRTAEPLPRTIVTQLLPAPLRHVSARPAAEVTGREVVWRVPLPARAVRSLTTTGRVGDLDGHDLAAGRTVRLASPADDKTGGPPRLETTVCVRAPDHGRALTCSTSSAPVSRPFWRGNRAYMTISAVAALAVGIAGVLYVRRRRASPPAKD
ncbi:hypothetical protein SRB5_12710 [Streptomyces sp. RB5]|uniref:DUF11 domain-containing protein n=1 Tax=Streptomyces smaragdinus TaxID=2585196 RepID=A0A7K0CCH1_9ACTN|nr:DUF11 domain-containing protein [Streptomyces smaragdinus]MQY11157.1 hypothetical protein [Streptomyces smaragdinus]